MPVFGRAKGADCRIAPLSRVPSKWRAGYDRRRRPVKHKSPCCREYMICPLEQRAGRGQSTSLPADQPCSGQ